MVKGTLALVKKVALLLLLLMVQMTMPVKAQMLIGTAGMMNTPTADMFDEGTFVGGVSFVPKEMELT